MSKKSEEQRVAELHEQARKDYGTPTERAERAGAARDQLALARMRASESAGAWRSKN